MITLHNLSTAEIRRAAREATGSYVLLALDGSKIDFVDIHRLEQVAADTGAAAVYGNYCRDGHNVPLIEMQCGSVRSDFEFGPVMLVSTARLKEFVAEPWLRDCQSAGFYQLWLYLMPDIEHVPETVTRVTTMARSNDEGEAQFQYVDPRNRAAQIEMEQVFTDWLRRNGCAIEPGKAIDHKGEFPVEVSVVIPVRNRVKTVCDAIRSALSQQTDFSFNVLVVDNYSTDGTTEAIDEIAAADSRLMRLTPDAGHGIGGCWNYAIDSPECGRYAVQLDSDDVYADANTLSAIVAKFRETGAAMVIGSYTLTDFDLNVIPPGLIDHAEWTDGNGPNNALRINGLGAPRAFFSPVARQLRFPDTSYGEDYAMALRISRSYRIARIFDSLYYCRRWGGNSDSNLSQEKINANNRYKDWIRSVEIAARRHDKH